jgi:hypothetical protein
MHQRLAMLLLSFCTSLPLGWLILLLFRGAHYLIFLLLLLPLFVAFKVSGLLLRGAVMPTPIGASQVGKSN